MLGFFDGEKYREKKLEGFYELVGMHGTTHIHAILGDEDCGTRSGHLPCAKVKVQNKLVVLKFTDIEFARRTQGNVKILGFRR